jgi:hypothetical protein
MRSFARRSGFRGPRITRPVGEGTRCGRQLATQIPFLLQVDVPLHSGTSSELLTGRQVPVPHALQAPVHAVSQQTPSLQNPDEHWLAPVQSWPLGRLAGGCVPQAPTPLQVAPLVHSDSGSLPAA